MNNVAIRIDYPDHRVETRELAPGVYCVGRGPVDIVLPDAGVSDRHAELRVDASSLAVVDLGSTNGTYDAHGQRVGFSQLQPGQWIVLGACRITRVVPAVTGKGTQVMPQFPAAPPPDAGHYPSAGPGLAYGVTGATVRRGTVLSLPGQGPGLLMVEGTQHPFQLQGVWRGATAPALNQAVEVGFGPDGRIVSIDVVDNAQRVKEQLREFGGLAQEQGRQAMTEAKRQLDAIPPGLRKKIAIGAAALLSMLLVGFVAVWIFHDPARQRITALENLADELGADSDCGTKMTAIQKYRKELWSDFGKASQSELRDINRDVHKRFGDRMKEANRTIKVGLASCERDPAFALQVAMLLDDGPGSARSAPGRADTFEGYSPPLDDAEKAALGVAGVLGGLTLLALVMALIAGLFWLLMFLDCLLAQGEDKIVWLLVVFFFNFLGAVLYYFLGRKKRVQRARAPVMPPGANA